MAKPKFKNKQKTKGKVLKRSRVRARRLIAANKMPKGVSPKGGISGREARALKEAAEKLKRAYKSGRVPVADRAHEYNPLEALEGRDFTQEMRAAEEYEFGGQRRELGEERRRLQQQEVNVGSYYDDYQKALASSVANIRSAADSTAAASQQRTDLAQQQDQARLTARDAEDAAVAAKFGRPATPSQEGQRAIEARGFMAQSENARIREQGLNRIAEAEQAVPQAALGKANAISRERARQAALGREERGLEKESGAFRTKYRADTRQSERDWWAKKKEIAAIEKEFKLESEQDTASNKLKAKELKIERLKSFNQLKQAMLYAGADRKMANSIVKQAKIQRDAKIISAKQYRQIANINKAASDRRAGANENVANTYANDGGGDGGKDGKGGGWGSGKGGKPAPWERDQFDRAYRSLTRSTANLNPGQKQLFIDAMRKHDIKTYIAARAWRIYWNRKNKPPSRPGNAPGPRGQGDRPT